MDEEETEVGDSELTPPRSGVQRDPVERGRLPRRAVGCQRHPGIQDAASCLHGELELCVRSRELKVQENRRHPLVSLFGEAHSDGQVTHSRSERRKRGHDIHVRPFDGVAVVSQSHHVVASKRHHDTVERSDRVSSQGDCEPTGLLEERRFAHAHHGKGVLLKGLG